MSEPCHSPTGALSSGGAFALSPDRLATLRPSRLGRLLALDEALLLALCRLHAPWRTALARGLTRAGDGKSWTLLGLALIATGTTEGVHAGARLGAAAILAALLAQLLKRCFSRRRPDVSIVGFEALAANPDRFSFPSGHTAAAVAVAVALAGAPLGAGPASLVLAVGIAISRVYLGAHYPLDVAAGATLGMLAGVVARLLVA